MVRLRILGAMRSQCSSLLLGMLAACASPDAPAPAVAQGESASVERLVRDVTWLADDAREGRRAGMPGGREAASWLARRCAELGLEPAGGEGFLQEFPVTLPARDGGGSRLAGVGGARFAIDDPAAIAPLFCSGAGRVQGQLVFCGYGILNPERDWDDYAGADLQGAVAMILRGTPPESGTARSRPTESRAGAAADTAVSSASEGWGTSASIFSKVMNAKRHGASGVVLLPRDPFSSKEPLLAFEASHNARASIPAVAVRGGGALRALIESDREAIRASLNDSPGGAQRPLPGGPVPSDVRVELFADVVRERARAANVIARLPGGEAPTLMVGAHFDHLGRGGPGSLAPGELGAIHNGADDNASGTAAVLELARLLAEAPAAPPGDLIFALWDAEELGLLGSEHFAQNPPFALEEVDAYLNLDMVGRAGSGKLQVLGAGSTPAFEGWLATLGPAVGLELVISLGAQGMGGSDHQTFVKREIPALHLFSGIHSDYHRPSDDVERFEPDGAARVVELCRALAVRIQASQSLPFVVVESDSEQQREGREGGFAVRFGSIPNYAYDGRGVLIDGTSPGSPAERAGLEAGDVLLQVGDVVIENIYDFVFALQTYKPGDVVLTRYLRAGNQEEVRVTLEQRGSDVKSLE